MSNITISVTEIKAWVDSNNVMHRDHFSAVQAEVERAINKLPQPTASQPIAPWIITNREVLSDLLQHLNEATTPTNVQRLYESTYGGTTAALGGGGSGASDSLTMPRARTTD